MRSSMSSMPTEIRTRPGVMPSRLRVSSGTDPCVIEIGCEINVSTPPSDSASEQSFTRSRNFLAFSYDPSSNEIIEPVSYTHLRAHETRHDLVCRLLLEKKKNK